MQGNKYINESIFPKALHMYECLQQTHENTHRYSLVMKYLSCCIIPIFTTYISLNRKWGKNVNYYASNRGM